MSVEEFTGVRDKTGALLGLRARQVREETRNFRGERADHRQQGFELTAYKIGLCHSLL